MDRKIQEIGRHLRAYCHDRGKQYLPWAEYTQNSLRLETTGFSPFQCMLGFQPPLFPWSGASSEVPAVDAWFQKSRRVWDSAHVHLQRARRKHKKNADTRLWCNPIYHPGDCVLLSTHNIRHPLRCKKLSPRYIGPFPIKKQINDVTYELQLPDRSLISPTFHVSLLKPYIDPVLPPSTEPEPLPPEIDPGESIYVVNQIQDSRRLGGRLQYLIDLEGYGPEGRSWVDHHDVIDPALLSDFQHLHPDLSAPRGHGRPRRQWSVSEDVRGGGGNVTDPPTTPPSHTGLPASHAGSNSPEYSSPTLVPH